MIYDCFTFFNELDLLELRLNILNDVVDKFVIVEGSKTFAGKDKPLNFKENEKRYEKFKDKIIYIVFDDFPPDSNAWIKENLQRNAIAQGLVNCSDDDIILISDLDEIIAPEAIKEAIKRIDNVKPIKKFVQYNMRYYLNLINCNEPLWFHPEMCTYKNFKNCMDNVSFNYSTFCPKEVNLKTTATKIRMCMKCCELIPNGGWHFSFMGGAQKIIYKFENYSHQEYKPHIEGIMRGVAQELKNVNSTNTAAGSRALSYSILPEYLQNNIEKYKDYISETPVEKLNEFSQIETKQFKDIEQKFLRYSIQRFVSLGKARVRYSHKYNLYKEMHKILKYYTA